MNNYTVVPIISSKCARFPRDYQLELYEIATKANTIVALPTGSGKTLISSLIMYHYLTHANHQDQIIVYLAPTELLASQQSKALVEDTYELFEDSNVYVQLVIGEKSELISYNENNYEECFNFKLISTWKVNITVLFKSM
jgi:ERCC4-related helicase